MAPLFWLAYQTAKSRRVVIVRASHLIAARLRAAPVVEGIEDVAFVEGHELPAAVAKRVPCRHGRPIADGSRGGADFGRDGGVRGSPPSVMVYLKIRKRASITPLTGCSRAWASFVQSSAS